MPGNTGPGQIEPWLGVGAMSAVKERAVRGDVWGMSGDDATLLYLVGRHLATTEDMAELADVLDLLMERLSINGGVLTTFATPQYEPLRFAVGDPELDPLLEALVARARDRREPMLLSSLEARQLAPGPAGSKCGAALAVPILDRAGHVSGVLALSHARPDGLGESHVALVTAVAYQMAAALRQARLAGEVRRRAYELSLLDEIGQAFSSLDLEPLLRLIVRRISRTLRVNRAALFLLDAENKELILRAVEYPGFSESVLGMRIPLHERPNVADAIHTGRPVEVPNIYADPRWRGFWLLAQQMELEASLAVPLIVKGQAIGAISVERTAARPPFTPSEVSLCQIIANQAAAAIESARLFSAVHNERAKLEAIIAGAGDVVIVTDLAGHVLLMNRAAEKAFQITAEETVGHLLFDHVANPDVQRLWRGSEGASAYPLVGEVALRDGRTLYANLMQVPQVGLIAVMQDISHLKELDRMKSEFVSTVSHDLQSPLQAIRLSLDVLPKMGPLNQEQQESIASAKRMLARITQLVRDLLDLGRIEAGVGLERRPCSLGEIVATTAEDLQPRVRMMGLSLTTQIPEELPDVEGDSSRLAQVISNLIDNAIKYTPAGGQIQVTAQQKDHEVWVEVKDNGPGIAREHQARLFEKFYRAPGVQREEIAGTGLGLAIVKSIVEAHGGRVWVESSMDPERHGSTFGFAIPVEKEEGEKEAAGERKKGGQGHGTL